MFMLKFPVDTRYAPHCNSADEPSQHIGVGYALRAAPLCLAWKRHRYSPGATRKTRLKVLRIASQFSEAAGRCNGFEARIALLQTSPRCFQAQALDELRWGHVHLGAKHAREVARAHAHARRKLGDRKVVAQMLHRPRSQLGKRWTIARLQSEC